jgi:hypothetical protein
VGFANTRAIATSRARHLSTCSTLMNEMHACY